MNIADRRFAWSHTFYAHSPSHFTFLSHSSLSLSLSLSLSPTSAFFHDFLSFLTPNRVAEGELINSFIIRSLVDRCSCPLWTVKEKDCTLTRLRYISSTFQTTHFYMHNSTQHYRNFGHGEDEVLTVLWIGWTFDEASNRSVRLNSNTEVSIRKNESVKIHDKKVEPGEFIQSWQHED